ncbi:MAG: TMEM175 family protein [Solirubrobacterales bacterium]
MPGERQSRGDRYAGVDFDPNRVATFNDAVIAIVITLLVLDLSPEIANGATSAEVWDALKDLIPNFIAYAFSFWLISRFWISNFFFFNAIKTIDIRTVRMNVFFLFTIALLPFPTAVLAKSHVAESAVIFYALVLTMASGAQAALWWRLESPEVRSDETYGVLVRVRTLQYLFCSVIFLISIPVALLNVYAAMTIWVLFGFSRLFSEFSTENSAWAERILERHEQRQKEHN